MSPPAAPPNRERGDAALRPAFPARAASVEVPGARARRPTTMRHPRRSAPAVYLDLDGTLVEPDGRVVAETLDVLAHVREHGRRPVLLTGRSRWAAEAVARALGIDDVICELGAVVRVGGHVELAAPEAVPFPREALLAALPDDGTQEHEPATPRTSGLALRSALAADVLTDVLHGSGLGHWCCVDNGPSRVPLDDGRPARVVHVLPTDVDKARGIRLHLQLRDLLPERCAVVGDSPADLLCRTAVARTVLVRSGDATAMAAAAAAGVPITAATGARGALEAVRSLTAAPASA